MINSRDSYSEYNPNMKNSIEVPFSIGTIIELKEDSTVLAKICQYRITNEGISQVIRVGLSYALNKIDNEQTSKNSKSNFKITQQFAAAEFSDLLDAEITAQELDEQWQKTEKMIIGKINIDEHSNQKQKTYARSIKRF